MRNTFGNKFKLQTLVLGLATLVGATSAQAGYYVELSTSYNRATPEGKTEAKNNLSSGFYVSGSYDIAKSWSLGFDWATALAYVSASEFKLDQDHALLRVLLNRKDLNWLPGWKTSFLTRWAIPTTPALQQAGGFGELLLRPTFKRDFGQFGLTVRPQTKFALVDKAYQKYTTPGGSVAGNGLFTWALEIFPSYKIRENMSVTLLTGFSQKYTGGANGQSGTWSDMGLSYEVVVGIPAGLVVDLAASVSNSTKFNKDFNVYKSDSANYTFYVSKGF